MWWPPNSQGPSSSDLHRFVQAKLPEYMVPSAFVWLDALPMTHNGKVNRQALPAPENLRPELEAVYVAPSSEVEQHIAAIWREVLGIDQVGIHDNFFHMGGHSLKALQVIARLRRTFQAELSVRAMFETPTVAGLAEGIEQAKDEAEEAEHAEMNRLLAEVEGLPEDVARRLLAGERAPEHARDECQ
jgi:acyl carrier protein